MPGVGPNEIEKKKLVKTKEKRFKVQKAGLRKLGRLRGGRAFLSCLSHWKVDTCWNL